MIRLTRRPGALCSGRASAISARMPPSPRLSARSTTPRYFTEITRISDQKISDSTPITLACVGGTAYSPKKHSRIAYSGLVPMSPYTTPSAPRQSSAR